MVGLNAGDLDRVLQLKHRLVTKNPTTGEDIVSYPTTYATVYAGRKDMTGTKRIIAQQTISQQLTEYTLRYRADVSITDQVTDAQLGLSYEIMQIAQMGRREGLNLLCRLVVS